MRFILIIAGVLLSNFIFGQENLSEFETNWAQWRGPYATGIASIGDPPIEWSEIKNVKWKVEIPGKGHSTPIVWGKQIILLSAVETEKTVEIEKQDAGRNNQWMKPISTNHIHEFIVLSLDRESGKTLWKTVLNEELPHSGTHNLGSWASNSPVTDGKHIYAYFGSHGLYCVDMNGKLVWKRDLGEMQKAMSFGEGSSPVLYKDKLIVLRDHEGQSSMHVMDKTTGKDIWKTDRDEGSTWVTPFIYEYEANSQLIVSATGKIRAYNIETGDLIWECSGLTRNVIPMPVVYKNLIYLMSGFRGSALLAVDISKAKGDINDSDAIVWKYDQYTPYTPSPILVEDKLYFLRLNKGFLSCLDAKDGKENYTIQKLEGIQDVFASPVAVNNRIYIPGANGIFSIVKCGPEFKVIANNKLDDGFHASPVIIGNNLYLRGFKYLYCISKEE
jgi:outer membrane protein assembly factor BamB